MVTLLGGDVVSRRSYVRCSVTVPALGRRDAVIRL
jgi:hypothetical protein